MRRFLPILGGLVLLLAVGCSQNIVSQATPSVAAPAAGLSTLSGQVVANSDRAPIEKVLVRLANVYEDAATKSQTFALDLANAPGTITDAQGFFAIADVKPGKYVMVIGDYYAVHDIISESNGDAKVYDAQAGQLLNIGVLPVKPDVTTTN